jgi:hypothetical protein
MSDGYCRLAIADCQLAEVANGLEIGNWHLAIGN